MTPTSKEASKKWTKGPWNLVGESDLTIRSVNQNGCGHRLFIAVPIDIPNADGGYAQTAANARLMAAAPALYEALEKVLEFYPRADEDSTERFERIADTFRRETGYLRPGKDCRLHSTELREKKWDEWHEARIEHARAALSLARTPEGGVDAKG